MSANTKEKKAGSTKLTTPSDREVVTERVFDAPRDRVYAAFTDPELIPQWWGLRSTTTVVDKLDVRPGGAWRFVERNSDGSENGFRGTFREVTPPESLVYTFEWEGMPGHVVVDTVTFEDLDGRTKVTNTSLFHTTEERDGMLESGMEKGLNESYEQLDGLLAKTG
ncbi:MAG: SRPBCC family protein [Solirubrobacterales bacterium]